jgi:protocatechuate 3,4-dioxygenase beta subunit
MNRRLLTGVLAFGLLVYQLGITDTMAACPPTPQDALGPFYKPDAPMRSAVGQGYVLTGTVRSSKDCSAVDGARIEFWLAGPNGRYDDDHRATLLSGKSGGYRFESNFPPPYSGRRSHIHIRVSAPGYKALVTQHYPDRGRTEGEFDLVLIPSQ